MKKLIAGARMYPPILPVKERRITKKIPPQKTAGTYQSAEIRTSFPIGVHCQYHRLCFR